MNKSKGGSSRLISVDVIRVLAMLMVIYLHTILNFTLRPDFFSTKAWIILEPFAALSRTSIPLFFILSGYLVVSKNRTIRENWNQLKKRILIPLVVSTISIVLLEYRTYTLLPKHQLSFWQSQASSLTDFPSSWLWFLIVLFFLYLLNPVWQVIFTKKEYKKTALYLTSLAFIFAVSITLIKYPSLKVHTFFNSFTGWLGYACFYFYGALVRNGYLNMQNKGMNRLFIGGGLILAILSDYYIQNTLFHGQKFIYAGYSYEYLSLPVIFMSIGIFNLLIHAPFRILTVPGMGQAVGTVVMWLSGLSYGIYLIHLHVIYFFFEVLKFEFDKLHMNIYLFSLIYYPLVLVCSILLCFLIKKTPKLRIIIGEE